MALETLYKLKANTYLTVKVGTNKNTIIPGGVAAVDSTGALVVGGANEAAPVGIFQVQGNVPAYQSTGLLDAQINSAVGSPGGGKTVSYLSGAGAMLKTDQFTNLAGAAIGSELVGDAGGLLKVRGMSTAPTIALLVGKDLVNGYAIVQMRI